jgi:prepilin-type N-terminal cleavage/methylation domain-containing protein
MRTPIRRRLHATGARPVREPARAGFTLLEIAISLGVFAIGMLALAAMQLHAMRSGSSGRHATQAAAIAQSQMEQLQRLRWTDPDLADTAGAFTAPIVRSNTVQGDPNQVEMSYAVDWRISDVEPNWTRSIDVRVSWAEENRPNRSVVLSSLRYNREAL